MIHPRLKEAILAALIGTPLLIVAIEGSLRLTGFTPRPRVRVDTTTCYTEFEPGAHYYDRNGGLEHDLWLDSNGFRVPGAVARGEEAVPNARCRILALGDSFTEGLYVDARETWPNQLGRILSKRYDVRVDNGGFRAHSIVAQRFAALSRWPELRHDLVVLEHTANDIEELFQNRRDGCVGPRFPFLADLRIYGLAQEAAIRVQAHRRKSSASLTKAECYTSAAGYRELLLETVSEVRKSGRAFLFVRMAPFFCSALPEKGPFWEEYLAEIKQSLGALGVETLDVYDELMKPHRDLRPTDSHPNPAAYFAMAQRIAAKIEAAELLEHCRLQPRSSY